MKTVRVGIVGIGNIGTAHTNLIYSDGVDGFLLTAVCDISQERKEYCKLNYPNVSFFDDYEEMITSGKIDAVIIATPHKFHADMAITALNNGLHVLVEKPVDVTVTKAKELNDVAKKSGKVFAIMFNQRTNPVFIKAREIVKGGHLGELKRTNWIITNWYRSQKYYNSASWRATWSGEGGGVLLNQAPHNLDLWQWICGMPDEITAFCDIAKYHNIEVEDDVTIFARYKNGATGTFITTTGEYPGTNRLEISGDKGKIVLESGTLKWWKLPESERDFCFDNDFDISSIDIEYSEYKTDTSGEGHLGILKNFSQQILYGKEPISSGYEGINELALSNGAYLSQWKGNVPIKLPIDNEEFDQYFNKKKSDMSISKTCNNDVSGKYLKRWNTNW